MANTNLSAAKKAKNDEFYTQYVDIQKEIEAYLEYDKNTFRDKVVYCNCDDPLESNFFGFFADNFKRLGLKRLITTSYKPSPVANTLFDLSPYTTSNSGLGRDKDFAARFIIDDVGDYNGDGTVNKLDLFEQLKANKKNEWKKLNGDDTYSAGDFRSAECTALLKQADIVVTNPPFSLFREYVAQLVEYGKKFAIIGNINAITYKETFPLIKENKIWLGPSITSGDREFEVPESTLDLAKFTGEVRGGKYYQKVVGVRWYTNIDHGRRHQILSLMTMADNKKFNKKVQKSDVFYEPYDNYDAIEVSFVDGIPKDYEGVMGVPISFLDKYNPDQFEVIWQASGNTRASAPLEILKNLHYKKHKEDRGGCTVVNNKRTYGRILIRHRKVTR